jgi:PAS domain S-box-containing protein
MSGKNASRPKKSPLSRALAKIPESAWGPALALVAIALLRSVYATPFQHYAPFPISLLSVIVIYSVFRGGVVSGLISAFLAVSYLGYFLELSGAFEKSSAEAWNRLLSWSLALPVIVAIVGVLKRRSLQALAKQERSRTDMIVSHVSAVIWALDTDGVFTFSEGTGLQLVGLKPGERIGKSIFDLYARDSEIGRCIDRAMAGESCKTVIQVRQIWFEISISPSRDERGAITGVVGISIDVTARVESEAAKARIHDMEQSAILLRATEKELRSTTRRLETLISSSPVAILTLDREHKVTVWNPACEKMFGWTASEAMGALLPFVPESKRAESMDIIDKIQKTREPLHFESDRVRKDGTAIKTATAAIPLLNDSDEVIGLMAVMMDFTERFRAQQEVLEANRALRSATQAKSDFLANMSHEIRTPINGVIGTTALLLDLELGGEQRTYAETIRSSAEILLNLINDILDFSKIESGKLDLESIDFDVDHATANIERLLSVSAKKKGLRILRSISGELPNAVFRGDPTRIGQILTNLIGNAIKFTERGQIVVELSHRRTEIGQDGKTRFELLFEVTDTGIGMSVESQARMFQPFTQAEASTNRRFGGTGLGLSICKRLVEMMGGEIGVRSKEGEGSTFWFTLVLEKGDKKKLANLRDPAESVARVADGKTIRILLAEDNSVNRLIAVKMLEKNGFKVDTVVNGIKAIEALQASEYDLVLMDCQMPELDGYEATRRIRASGAKFAAIPIIAMTANAMSSDREKCLSAGMNDYVTKPIKSQDLARAIYRALDKRIAA